MSTTMNSGYTTIAWTIHDSESGNDLEKQHDDADLCRVQVLRSLSSHHCIKGGGLRRVQR